MGRKNVTGGDVREKTYIQWRGQQTIRRRAQWANESG